MKTSYHAYLLLALLGAIVAPSFAATSDTDTVPEAVSSDAAPAVYPDIKSLDETIRKLVLTIAATTMEYSAGLSDQGLLGDPVIAAVSYGHVLESVMTDETFDTLPQHAQKYFRTLLLLELGVVDEIIHLEDTTPASITPIINKLNAEKESLIPKYPKTAPVFNDLHALMTAVTEQYNIVAFGNHYRDNDIKMIYLAPDRVTGRVLHYLATYLNDILIQEEANANGTVDPDALLADIKESDNSNPDLDELDKNVYHFILELAATGMDVAADLAGEGLIEDPLVQAVTYGQILRAMLTPETLATLPSNYQAYFKRILELEDATTAKLAQLTSEDPQMIQVIVEERAEQQAELVKEFPLASAVFNEMDILIATVIQQFDLYNKAQSYRKEHLTKMDYSRAQKQAIVLRYMSEVLLEELAKLEEAQ